jgi:hypothetical protein
MRYFSAHRLINRIIAEAVFLFFICTGICAAGDFEISLGVQKVEFEPYGGVEGYYDEPLSRTITVTSFPLTFDVIIKNKSGSSQPIYEQADAGAESSLLFELAGEDGTAFEMRQKPARTGAFDDEVSQYLNPGETETIPLTVDPEDWENVPLIEPGKVKKYRMRVIYQNDFEKIYSDYYEIILDGQKK